MPYFTPSSRAVAALVIASHLLVATGCTSWKTQQGDVATVITPPPLTSVETHGVSPGEPGATSVPSVTATTPDTVGRIRVLTTTGDTVDLRNPRVASDSLYGQFKEHGHEVGFALADITAVQVRKGSADKTVLLVSGVLVATLIASVVALSAVCLDVVYSSC